MPLSRLALTSFVDEVWISRWYEARVGGFIFADFKATYTFVIYNVFNLDHRPIAISSSITLYITPYAKHSWSCLLHLNSSRLNPHLMYIYVLLTFSARSCKDPVAPATPSPSFAVMWNVYACMKISNKILNQRFTNMRRSLVVWWGLSATFLVDPAKNAEKRKTTFRSEAPVWCRSKTPAGGRICILVWRK